MIDFEGIDLLPEEKELAEAAKADIETFKERRVKERVKRYANLYANLYLKICPGLKSICIQMR
jgi:hypothetical protein